MRIIIDYNGSKVICKVTHFLNDRHPQYNDYVNLTDIDDDVFSLVIAALKKLAEELKKDIRKPFWMNGNRWRNRKIKAQKTV